MDLSSKVHHLKINNDSDSNYVYTFDNPRFQNLCLPHYYQKYLLQNYSPMAYFNLIKTCKLYYGQKCLLVVEKMKASPRGFKGTLKNENFLFPLETLKNKKIKLWIIDVLYCHYDHLYSAGLQASNIFPYFYSFDYSELQLDLQSITIQEYKVLVGSKKLKKVTLRDTTVENLGEPYVNGYVLLKKLLHVRELS